ncbi:PREDICTED: uncharacterized protein LOC109226391 [Nicotiana attenuata]|uniref:Uncharacterized protein n=1 Tax=Nicotiana attenuata TaxID=49451 RepID=A0A1J6IHE2_NICAT|nr:PREDICTED: uncharacterized protein LOC109226391 [Nicotiana attenuata]OIT03788.1 hypothetical protein A4A49_29121 [Nicotiana attenuata]
MACWSAESATKAYLRAIKMEKRAKEPDVSEFISALAAGNNAQLMVVACAAAADSTTLALVAAAQQTGGTVICILSAVDKLIPSLKFLHNNARHVEFVIGDAKTLLINYYRRADCIVIDCNLNNCEGILKTARRIREIAIVLGYNALRMGSWRCQSFNAHLLPIGEGLLVTKTTHKGSSFGVSGKKSRWIVKVDKCTGEEHVFRVRSSHGNPVEA